MKRDYIWITIITIIILLSSVVLSMIKPYMVVVVPLAFFVGIIYLHYGKIALVTSIIVLPFLSSIFMNVEILPIPGAKINNIIMLLLLMGVLLNYRIRFSNVKWGHFFYFGSITLLTVSVIRSSHVAPYSFEFWKEEYNLVKFFLSHGLIPILTTLPFFIIIGTIREVYEVNKVVNYIALSMGIFAVTILSIFIFKVPFNSDFSTVREIIGIDYLGMHGNNIADFFIVAFPLILSMSLIKENLYKKWFWAASLLSLLAVMIIYSRTAYAIIGLSIIAISILTKKYNLLVPAIIGILLITILAPSVTERALSGLDTGEANTITAGRTEEIWEEILGDIKHKSYYEPGKLIFGHGRYGVLALPTFRNQKMLRVTHSHNMYIDTLVDTGILGLLFYILSFSYILISLIIRFFKVKKENNIWEIHLISGLAVGIIGFLIRGFTDSFLLPQLTNSYVYIFIALSFVILGKGGSRKGEDI